MIWVCFSVLVGFIVGGCIALMLELRRQPPVERVEALPERTANMCEYGFCRDKWTTYVNLGLHGFRYVCDKHVEPMLQEYAETEFEAMGVRS